MMKHLKTSTNASICSNNMRHSEMLQSAKRGGGDFILIMQGFDKMKKAF